MKQTDEKLRALVNASWNERMSRTEGDVAQPKSAERRKRMRTEFDRLVDSWYERLKTAATKGKAALDYERDYLALAILKAVDLPCVLCGRYFGSTQAAIAYRFCPKFSMQSKPFAFVNLVVCCEHCERGKGELSVRVWLDVLAALKGEEGRAAELWMQRVELNAAGWRRLPKPRAVPGGGAKVLPRGAGCG